MKQQPWPQGIKRTRQREAVWSVLCDTDRPLTATDIAERIGDGRNTWMSTVYRTLEILESKGVITRTNLASSDMAYYEITPHTHRHYAVCTRCGAMIPLHTCPVVEIPSELAEQGFSVTNHNLEIYGICKNCQHRD